MAKSAEKKVYPSFEAWKSNFFPSSNESQSFSDDDINEVAKCLADHSIDHAIRSGSDRKSAVAVSK